MDISNVNPAWSQRGMKYCAVGESWPTTAFGELVGDVNGRSAEIMHGPSVHSSTGIYYVILYANLCTAT
ncbi:unnamed protein product [Ascophyllum nodosum]